MMTTTTMDAIERDQKAIVVIVGIGSETTAYIILHTIIRKKRSDFVVGGKH